MRILAAAGETDLKKSHEPTDRAHRGRSDLQTGAATGF